uniref:Putative LOC101240618 [Hydra vulgaris] n=1 Tax=Lepeophtheirus salmonis TaxID=72036 RepID=A0A0K2U620_LEPSM
MVLYCYAYGCSNKSTRPGLSFHRFPKDQDMRQKWIRAVRRKDFPPSPISVLCSEHFLPEDYLDGQEYRVLKKLQFNAVPSKFQVTPLNVPSKGRKRRLSESHQEETNENLDINIQIIATENTIDPIQSINMDHSYAFPSDHNLAKAKYDRHQFLLEKAHLKEKKLGRKLHNACLKNQNIKLELFQILKSIQENELLVPQIISILECRFKKLLKDCWKGKLKQLPLQQE